MICSKIEGKYEWFSFEMSPLDVLTLNHQIRSLHLISPENVNPGLSYIFSSIKSNGTIPLYLNTTSTM
jgi:hypothetical protein